MRGRTLEGTVYLKENRITSVGIRHSDNRIGRLRYASWFLGGGVKRLKDRPGLTRLSRMKIRSGQPLGRMRVFELTFAKFLRRAAKGNSFLTPFACDAQVDVASLVEKGLVRNHNVLTRPEQYIDSTARLFKGTFVQEINITITAEWFAALLSPPNRLGDGSGRANEPRVFR